MASGSKRVVYAALGANFGIAAAKLAVGIAVSSTAMLAEAAHSFADTINQIFLLLSINLGDNEADEAHPYGHGKERFFWAFLAAVFIFAAGAIFSFYQGLTRFFDPQEHEGSIWPSYLVLGIAFAFDGSVFVIAIREFLRQARERGQSAREFLRWSPDVTLKASLAEDQAATIGLIIAAGGLVMLQITGDSRWDAVASILIGVVLITVAITLGSNVRDLLLGASAEPRIQEAIRAEIGATSGVIEIVELLTMQLGPQSILVTGKLDIRDGLSSNDIENLLQGLSARIRDRVPEARNIYLQPQSGRASVTPNEH